MALSDKTSRRRGESQEAASTCGANYNSPRAYSQWICMDNLCPWTATSASTLVAVQL